jgi:hypothetical protein
VPPSSRRPWAAWGLLLALAAGCGPRAAAPPPAPIVVTAPADPTPGAVELSDAVVTLAEPGVARFEVKYRFTKGRPDKFYACHVSFPGTPNRAVKSMQHWQLKAEGGVIRDAIALAQPGVTTFEITLAEAPTGQDPYTTISNVARGTVR